jgi:glycosyltransferase involved in cell wall biosynthesis
MLRECVRILRDRGLRIANEFELFSENLAPVTFVTEKADWAIKTVGVQIQTNVNQRMGYDFLTTTDRLLFGKTELVHFGSQYMWLESRHTLSKRTKSVVSFFHGKPEDGPEVAMHIDRFLSVSNLAQKIIVPNSIMEKRCRAWGIDPNRLVKIPIGCDTERFRVNDDDDRKIELRNRFGIPCDAFVVGSFQKDGDGWGDGLQPKLIKGPDLFVETMIELKKTHNVFVVLTGPARGYVKSRLDEGGVPYLHRYIASSDAIADFYHLLDLYLVSSREEGGPMGLTEAIASGVDVISTDVGQARDIMGEIAPNRLVAGNRYLDIAEAIEREMSNHSDLKRQVKQELRQEVVSKYDWHVVAESHLEKVYLDSL